MTNHSSFNVIFFSVSCDDKWLWNNLLIYSFSQCM